MKRPMIYLLVYFASGIILGRYLADVGYLLVLLLIAFLCVTIFLCRRWKIKAPFLFLLFLFIGMGTTHWNISEADSQLSALAAKSGKVTIEQGQVTEVPSKRAGEEARQSITVKCSKISYFDGGFFGSHEGNIKLTVLMPEGKNVKLWDIVSFSGELLPLEHPTAPGAFDEWLYYKTRDYDYKMFPEAVKQLGNEPIFFISTLRNLKSRLHEVYDHIFPERESGIVKAMTTGDKKSLDDFTKLLYQKAGISHILAISGLHVSALALVLFFLLESLKIFSKRQSALLVICFLITFAMFTGFSAATVRAVVMVSVGMLGIFMFRAGDALNYIAIAATLILLIQPLYIFDIGFQMSFITVTGILFCVNIFKKFPHIPEWKQGICASFVATMVSYPITAYYFHWISLVAVLANIVVIPMMTILLGVSFLAGICGLIWMPAGIFFGGAAYGILRLIEFISTTLSKVPNSFVCIGSPSVAAVCLWYACVVAIYCYRPNKLCKIIGIVLPIALMASIVSNRLLFRENKLAFLDVGQGDSTVLTTYDKKAFVFDTGGRFWAETGNNTGERILMPYLSHEGINEIEGLLLSHMDSDHALGALELMKNMSVKGLYISDYPFEPSLLYAQILVMARSKNIPVYLLNDGQEAVIADDVKVSCLYPKAEGGVLFGDDNNGSMVLKLSMGQTSVVLTGDASIEDEAQILKDGNLTQGNILKVGHHGSKYSGSAEFLQQIKPELAIVSCGANNGYGHPHEEALKRLKDEGIKILRTDKSGTITILTNGKEYRVKTMIEGEINEGIKKTN